jgi:hypothetical protein
MGIINPRPAMRRGEERRVKNVLERHAFLWHLMASQGVDHDEASHIAYTLVRTSKARQRIWRA